MCIRDSHGAAVDEADVVGARGVVEGELEALLAQEHLVLVDEVDGRGHHVMCLSQRLLKQLERMHNI